MLGSKSEKQVALWKKTRRDIQKLSLRHLQFVGYLAQAHYYHFPF